MTPPDRAASERPAPVDAPAAGWSQPKTHPLILLARNVSTRYVLLAVNLVIGLLLIRYNVTHLGKETYGLWMLAASVTGYFTVLDLGYGGAVVRFVAECRARRDVQALNEVLSTMAYVFSALGVVCACLAMLAALLLPYVFNLAPGQETDGRLVLLLIGLYVSLSFHFGVYGGVINGFERYYVNNVVGLVVNLATAAVNVLVLWLGYGLIELVASSTVMRIAPLWIYRRNAYRVFPELQIRRHLFRRNRLRELTGFSIHVAAVDWANRVIYASDTFYVGVFMNMTAVALYAVAQRVTESLLTLTQQIHVFLMPVVVHRALDGGLGPQQSLMVRATRFQLAIAVCLCGGVAGLAGALIAAWLGPGWESTVAATQILAMAVIVRASIAMPTTVLQGTGHQRFVAGAASAAAAVSLLISIPLVLLWGVVGVAVGTLIASATCAAAVFPKACHVLGLRTWTGVRQIVLPTLWPSAIVVPLTALAQPVLPAGFLPAAATLAAGALGYAAIFLLFGLEREERQWLWAACQRIGVSHSHSLPIT